MKTTMMFRVLLSGILFVFCAQNIWAQSSPDGELIEVKEEVTIKPDEKTTLRKEAFKEAIERVTLRNLDEILGADFVEKNKKQLLSKIVAQSAQFVPSIRSLDNGSKNQTKMVVILKLSLGGLRSLLKKEGFLNRRQKDLKIVSLISVSDLTSADNYVWWISDPKGSTPAKETFGQLQQILKTNLAENQNILVLPKRILPMELQKDSFSTEELKSLSRSMETPLFIRGRIVFDRDPNTPEKRRMNLHLEFINAENGRRMIEQREVMTLEKASKALPSEAESSVQEFATRLNDTIKRGLLFSTSITLRLEGNIAPRDLEYLKNQILLKVGSVKAIQERRMEKGRVEYEVETDSDSPTIAKTLSQIRIDRFQLSGVKFGEKVVQAEIESRAAAPR